MNSNDNMNSEFKRNLTSSNQIVDDQNIANDNTNDKNKTNYAEMELSRHEESGKRVANTESRESKQQQNKNQKKPSAILEKNNVFNLQLYASLGADKISNLFLVCALFMLTIISLVNIGEFPISLLCKYDEMSSFYIVFSLSVVIVILLTYMWFYILRQSIDNVVISLENECNLFEKAVLLSIDLYYDNKSYLSKQSPRSRYANYCIAYNVLSTNLDM